VLSIADSTILGEKSIDYNKIEEIKRKNNWKNIDKYNNNN